jgi:Na+-transporting methylmalonyl-CoA/oxaloacetate decarboxylase gamma subunit
MLTTLGFGIVCAVLLNLLGIVALMLSYVWHDWLRPRQANRRARQRAFERLIAHTTLDVHSMISDQRW